MKGLRAVKNLRDQKQNSGCQGVGEEVSRELFNKYGFSVL
jgi:hypothetical protein